MDPFFTALIAVVIAFPVLAVAAFLLALANRGRLKRLEHRLVSLEARLAGPAGEASLAAAPSEKPPQTVPAAKEPEKKAEETAPPPPEPQPKAAQAPLPAGPEVSLEERFGTQWVVWAGGIALALGGFFLVRYSIEQGWFGPGARVIVAAIVALALVAAGEWTRRREITTGLAGLPKAHIPSVLTAAGTAIAYADAYAAYALYDFIGPGVAFVLLGLVALGTLAAALLHGRGLAGLGLIGAFLTPLIVSTEAPNYLALYLYLAVVTAASFALARARLWRWLAITAVIASVLWTFPGIGELDWLPEHVFHIGAGFVLAAALIVSGFLFGPPSERGEIDLVSSGALAAYLFAAMLLVLSTGHDSLALLLFCVLVVGTLAIAWRTDAAALVVPVAALFVAAIFWHWSIDFDVALLGLPNGPVPDSLWKPEHYLFGTPLSLGAAFGALFLAAGFLAQGPGERRVVSALWAGSAVFAPIAILIALYYRIAGFDRSIPFAGAAVVLAGIFALATELIAKREGEGEGRLASGIFATGSIASLALALSLALEKGWLTVALALMVPGIAWVAEKRPLPASRWLAAAMTMAVLGRIIWDPEIVGGAIGAQPVFNWLLYGYGIPAAAFWLGGYMLRRQADDVPTRLVESAAILFTVLLVVMEVRHYVTGGDPYTWGNALAETALDVSLLLAVLIGLERVRLKSGSVIHDWGARFLAVLLMLTIVSKLGVDANPLIMGDPVGPPLVNLVLLGYGLPAVLLAILAYVTRKTRPRWYGLTALGVALALAFAYLTLEVARLFHGPVLTAGEISDAEQYTYSAVWLGFGVALLAAGIFYRSLPLRIASAAVIVLTVLKVFLVDMSDLTGFYRALSFLGLGAVLMGIGWFYQRLLFPRRTLAGESPQG
ncbi:DUF2339 domain-containing protein [Methyloceanibacter sp.]|uniref:DUF2339 domain-containing protein n=1 Tax=Methyloceanibacter sp. TaxID=1965321 RepID=UPI002D6FCE9C|nr:DUF2339 domain-containing protein [Methyloceanibacter sp.]HZP08589.1 DUF2339 domain-containing protein [Methyloceanibacter sp.]